MCYAHPLMIATLIASNLLENDEPNTWPFIISAFISIKKISVIRLPKTRVDWHMRRGSISIPISNRV